jgi:hypothetical protein
MITEEVRMASGGERRPATFAAPWPVAVSRAAVYPTNLRILSFSGKKRGPLAPWKSCCLNGNGARGGLYVSIPKMHDKKSFVFLFFLFGSTGV